MNLKNQKNAIRAAFQAKIDWEGREREKIKIIVSFRSYPTRNRKFQKNSRTIQKIKKTPLFQAIIGWKRLRKREKKNYRFVSFQPDAK